jgi:hypothetical protein
MKPFNVCLIVALVFGLMGAWVMCSVTLLIAILVKE